MLPAVALVRVVVELPLGAGAARGGLVRGRLGELARDAVVEIKIRPWQLAGFRRRDAPHERVAVKHLLVHGACC
jgi:hypothetical protein